MNRIKLWPHVTIMAIVVALAAGLAVALEFEERKMKRAMAQANKARARYALIIGDNEIATGNYGLKNMATGEQESLDLESIKSKLK